MRKKIITFATIFAIGAPALAACGATTEPAKTETTTTQDDEATTAAESTATVTDTAETVTSVPESGVNPYAWLGLQDMPKCNYLDILSTGKYYQTYEHRAMGISSEQEDARDGVNTYTKDANTTSYSIDGKVISINEASKFYMEYDIGSLAQTAKDAFEDALKNGTNTTGRSFVGTGKGIIPTLDDDKTEYDYYEYNNPEAEEAGSSMTERFYLKDGDVYAIYEKISLGGSDVETVKIIKSISGEIPASTFELPDLSGYTKYE